jgi:hypothetical protein
MIRLGGLVGYEASLTSIDHATHTTSGRAVPLRRPELRWTRRGGADMRERMGLQSVGPA